MPVNVINSYGLTLPTLTAIYSGFVNGDTSASLTSPVSLSVNANQHSPVGVYYIIASGVADSDYSVVYLPGAVAIVPNPGAVAFVNSLYKSFLGRPAESYGYVYWLGVLADGTSEEDVANQIYNSAEAKHARSTKSVPVISEKQGYRKGA